MTLVVRTAGEPAGLIRVIQNEVAALDPDQPLSGVATMSQLVAGSMATSRFQSGLLSVLAASALILAAIGIYGLIAFSVSQRTREIGVRMALGAARRDVLIMVVKQGLILVLIGGGTGLVAALGLARLLRHLLPGVRPTDPVTFIAVSLVLVAVALLAGYIPARRAMKINPMEALRYE